MIHKNITKLCISCFLTYILLLIFAFVMSNTVFAAVGASLSTYKEPLKSKDSNSKGELYQQAKLKNINSTEASYIPIRTGPQWVNKEEYAKSVAVYNDFMVIGSPGEDSSSRGIDGDEQDNSKLDSGAVYVYKKIDNDWKKHAFIKASDSQEFDGFGSSVTIDNNIMIVGALKAGIGGKVYVYELIDDIWFEKFIIEPEELNQGDFFGPSLSISNNIMVIGAKYADGAAIDSGIVYIYKLNDKNFEQVAKIQNPNPHSRDYFGFSVDIFEKTLIIGVPNAKLPNPIIEEQTGAAYVYQGSDSNDWILKETLKSTGNVGNRFGYSVAIDESSIIIGAPFESISEEKLSRFGAVYSYQRFHGKNNENETLINLPKLLASNKETNDFFGTSVDVFENTLIVGAPGESSGSAGVNGDEENNNAVRSGAVYQFSKQDGNWLQLNYIKSSNPANSSNFRHNIAFGESIAISAESIVVGSPGEKLYSGAVYIYDNNSVPLKDSHTGLWYDTDETGHGLNFYLLADNRVVALWYTYDNEGNPMWLSGVGTHNGHTAIMDVHTRSGGSFPPSDDDSSEVNLWGKFTVTFTECNTGYFNWTPLEGTGFIAGSTKISRLTNTNGINCNNTNKKKIETFSMKDSNSALWFNSSEALLSNTYMLENNRILHMWYTFDNDHNPVWLQGIGTHDGIKATMDAYIVDGGKFPPYYNPEELNINHWGKFELEFADCNVGLFKWTPNQGNGYSSGETVLNRLTNTKGLDCI